MNGITAIYVGNHYEVKNSIVTKYYFAGATRIAVRTGGTLSFLLGDHIGSSSVTTDANGVQTASALYKAFGETRYTLGNLGTDYKFTGQREEAALGIYFFNARWMDPSLGRFTSPDTIVPTGTQAWDRYAFVNNNPVRYNDPTGHWGFDLSATVNSAINWGLSGVNTLLGTGFTSADVARGCDTLATVLDVGAAAISTSLAFGEATAAGVGFTSGAASGFVLGGAPITGFAGAGLGVAMFDLSPEVMAAGKLADELGWTSTRLTALSDVITGDTNISGSVSGSGSSANITLNASIGRDTASSAYLSYLGSMAPLQFIDAGIDWVGLGFDAGYAWNIWPLSEVPESIPLVDVDAEIGY
jgi:RHS repeat-associated protein